MRRLVALDLPGGPRFVDGLRRALDDGDAVLPLDQRLPPHARARLARTCRAGAVIDATGTEHALEGGEPVEDGDALVVATSGSTGAPKAVVLGADAVAASARATSARLGIDPGSDRWLCCLPLSHVGGLSVLTRALLTATPVELLPRFDPGAVLDAARERGATRVSLVPTALGRLGAHAGVFRTVLLGGAAPTGPLPANAVTTYGMTETGSGVVYDGVALEGVEVRVGAAGEIALRGPMLLRAYRDGTNPKDPDGWLWTGDGGEIGPDGRLVVHGRLAEVVSTGGELVWPGPVEEVLSRHPAVAEVGVGGVADPEWGERVVAYVVVSPGAPAPRLAELRRLVADELGPVCAPKELVLLDALPRTALGKLRRGALGATPAPGAREAS